MGRIVAEGINEMVDRRTALEYHLQYNHYPPVPLLMVEVAEKAIDAFMDEEYERLIPLPEGVSYKDKTEVEASVIVEAFHLDTFLEQED